MNLEWIEKDTSGCEDVYVYSGPESIRKPPSYGWREAKRLSLLSLAGEGSGCSQGACTSWPATRKPGPTAWPPRL